MNKKQAEEEFKELLKIMGFELGDWLKFRDVMLCPVCHSKLWKDESKPDFVFYYRGRAYLCECKQGLDRWNFSDNEGAGIRDIQRLEMDRWELKHGPCFLFLLMGTGHHPDGLYAWLVPWSDWKVIETELDARGQKTLGLETKQNDGALDLLKNYTLRWIPGSSWEIPLEHPFWGLIGGPDEKEIVRRAETYPLFASLGATLL